MSGFTGVQLVPMRLLICLLAFLLTGCAVHVDEGVYKPGKSSDKGTVVEPLERKSDKEASSAKKSRGAEHEYDHLWMGAVSSLSFMKITLASKESGLIATDWYESKVGKGERYMVNVVVIRGIKPSPASYRVTIKKQILDDGRWVDVVFDHRLEYEVAKKMYNRSKKIKAAVKIGV